MKNAKELLEEFATASFRDPKEAAEMFTEDGAFEMPYLESLGVPGRYEGREAIEGLFREQDRTDRPRALFRAAGRGERQDQASP
jgi:hypothetical protein